VSLGNIIGESGGDWGEVAYTNSPTGGDGSVNVQTGAQVAVAEISGGSVAFTVTASAHWDRGRLVLIPAEIAARVALDSSARGSSMRPASQSFVVLLRLTPVSTSLDVRPVSLVGTKAPPYVRCLLVRMALIERMSGISPEPRIQPKRYVSESRDRSRPSLLKAVGGWAR
jgi:hypothetical protein